jgi:tRNA-dihydrouridine synthase A
VPVVHQWRHRHAREAKAHLAHVDGVMLGRAAYQEPWRLLGVDPELFGEARRTHDEVEALAALLSLCRAQLARGVRLHAITRHLTASARSRRAGGGARAFRRHL